MPRAVEANSHNAVILRPPGFLLAPFGWAAERVVTLLQKDPALSNNDLIYLSRIRMHLIALAFAHRVDDRR